MVQKIILHIIVERVIKQAGHPAIRQDEETQTDVPISEKKQGKNKGGRPLRKSRERGSRFSQRGLIGEKPCR